MVTVEELHVLLRRGIPDDTVVKHDREFIRNLAYSLQYIDHLVGQIEQGVLRDTLHSQTCKSIVVIGMGIVEALLWFVLNRAGRAATTKWEEIHKTTGEPFDKLGRRTRIDTIVMVELAAPRAEQMTLDAMVKRAEAHKLLGLEGHAVYGHLKHLRRLRNRIHIHDVQGEGDTDWRSFDGREAGMLLNALSAILTAPLFDPAPHHLELLRFLSPDRVVRRE